MIWEDRRWERYDAFIADKIQRVGAEATRAWLMANNDQFDEETYGRLVEMLKKKSGLR